MKQRLLIFFLTISWHIVQSQSTMLPVPNLKDKFKNVPGVVLGHIPAADKIYLGSPSICILPNGDYLASNDFFGPNKAARIGGVPVTRIYKSSDKGKTWHTLTDIVGQYMANLFVHNNEVYILGLYEGNGDIVIRKSKNGGKSWTAPTNANKGLLKVGSFHTAPTPVTVHNGRLWRAFEDQNGEPNTWPKKFRAFMASVPLDADLLKASNWTFSNEMAYDKSYLSGYFYGWLEGNAIATPDGQMLDLLRVHTFDKKRERVAWVKISEDGKTASFDAKTGFMDFPGGGKKFTIRYDGKSKKYWTLANYVPQEYREITSLDKIRNTLALCSSADLKTWQVDSIVLTHPDTEKVGFQYVDWAIDGDDMIAVSRTAFDDGLGGADSAHNNNFLTFHRIEKFRTLTNKNTSAK